MKPYVLRRNNTLELCCLLVLLYSCAAARARVRRAGAAGTDGEGADFATVVLGAGSSSADVLASVFVLKLLVLLYVAALFALEQWSETYMHSRTEETVDGTRRLVSSS